MFLDSSKEMWDALHAIYSQEKMSHVFELYEKLFSKTKHDVKNKMVVLSSVNN